MKTAIYVRVSTGLQVAEGTSLDGQIELCMAKAKELGFDQSATKLYKEEGFSGEDIDRPAMNLLRQDIKEGLFSHIICVHPDRLSRDMTDKLILCQEFDKNGVELVFVDTEYKNTPEGQLFFNMQSAIAQYELAMIRKRTVRGRVKVVEKDGKIMPMRVAPFGYELINSELVINEEEANVVKMIYQWYVRDNLTLRDIGNKLYQLGVQPKRGESSNWGASSISRILTSEIYIGNYFYNRRKTKKVKGERTASGNPKKTYEYRDQADWIKVNVPSIIDNDLFAAAQTQRRRNTRKSGNVKHEYLLKSIIRCAHCGRVWESTYYSGRGPKYFVYRCPNKNPKRYGDGIEKCPIPSIKIEVIEQKVWNDILKVFHDRNIYVNKMSAQKKTSTIEFDSAINGLMRQLEQRDKEKEKIKLMFRRDVISEDEMLEDIAKLNQDIKKLSEEINTYQQKKKNALENDLMNERVQQLIDFTLTNFKNETTEDETSNKAKRRIIETFIDEIFVDYVDGVTMISYSGLLGKIIGKSRL